jgi:hypothetical protein
VEWSSIALISLGFVTWAGFFIHNSSFITIAGRRSFSLFEDAMISMRYAWNFSHGHGLVWNPGEYVQGYTNLLMTLFMSLATLVLSKTLAVLAIQISGIVFMLLAAFLTMQVAGLVIPVSDPGERTFIRVLSFACGLLYYPLAYWSLMGMETGMQTVLMLAGIWLSFKHAQSRNPGTLMASAVCFGFAFLARNETILFVPLAWGYVLWQGRGAGADRSPVRRLTAALALYLVFVVGQLAFQYLYYGALLPNTYTLKLTGLTLAQRFQNGTAFVSFFLKQTWIILTLAGLGVLIRFSRVKLVLLTGILLVIGYQVYVGGDVWAHWRMMAPIIPLTLILNLAALFEGIRGLGTRLVATGPAGSLPAGRSALEAFLVIALLLPGLWRANSDFLDEWLLREKALMVAFNKENVNKAIALNRLLREGATIGVFTAGAIPYYVDRQAYDFLGKSDPYIARLPADFGREVPYYGMDSVPGHNKYDLNYSIVQLRPTYVERLDFGRYNLIEWGKDYYVEVAYEGYTLFLLKDSPLVRWSELEPAE